MRHIASVESAALKRQAQTLGFDAIGIAPAADAWPAGARLQEFIEEGRHGDMSWLADERDGVRPREHPQMLWLQAKSAILVGQSYATADDAIAMLQEKDRGIVSAYAARR